MSDTPAPELVCETFRPFDSITDQYGQLTRHYLVAGLPPIIVRVTMATGRPWTVDVLAMNPDGSTNSVLFGNIEAQTDNGDTEADKYAALAARLLTAAKEANR